MFFKKRLPLLIIVCLTWMGAYGQSGDFCKAIMTITKDAPDKFRNIRGNIIRTNPNVTTWESGIKVPGSIGCRFVNAMGLFYECGFYQTKNLGEVKAVYNKYKGLLQSCLSANGYKISLQPNFYPGLAEYKKLVFMLDLKEDAPADSAPAHISLEVTYNKEVGQYTVVLFIFEH